MNRLRALNEAATARDWEWLEETIWGDGREVATVWDESDAALIVALCNARDEIAALIEAASDSYRLIENSAARLAVASALDALREKGLA